MRVSVDDPALLAREQTGGHDVATQPCQHTDKKNTDCQEVNKKSKSVTTLTQIRGLMPVPF